MLLHSDGLAYINALKYYYLLTVPIPFLMAFKLFYSLVVLYGKLIHSTPLVPRTAPSVTLSYGTFQGMTTDGMDYFLGMPFAQATYVSIQNEISSSGFYIYTFSILVGLACRRHLQR